MLGKTSFLQRILVRSLASITVLLACGCATDAAWEERYAQGWRRAYVYRIGAANEISVPARHDCRKGLSAEALGSRPFVVYQYRGSGAFPWRYAVHPLHESTDLKKSEQVILNVRDCAGKPQRL